MFALKIFGVFGFVSTAVFWFLPRFIKKKSGFSVCIIRLSSS